MHTLPKTLLRRGPSVAGTFLLPAALLLSACGDGPAGPGQGPPPTVSAIEPAFGTVGTELRITGTNFRSGAQVRVGDFESPDVTVGGDAELFARVPDGVSVGSTYDVTVRNADGTRVAFPQAFTAVAPTLSFVNGASRPSGNPGSTVILEGASFGDAQGAGRVLFSDGAGGTIAAAISSDEDWTDGFILTTVPANAETGPVLVETATGQSESLPFTVTGNAVFSPSTIAWSETESLPVGLGGHSATWAPVEEAGGTLVQRVYVAGGSGSDSIPGAALHHTVILEDGSVSPWTTGTPLSAGIAHHAAVAATPFNSKAPGSGYLYLLGGVEGKGGQPVQAIQRLPLNPDGTLGAPEPAGSLPVPLHSFGAVLFRSTLYIAGGATTDHEPVGGVFRAAIDTLGNIGEWEELDALPESRAHHQFVGFGGFLYAVGGDTGATSIDDANFNQNASKLGTVAVARIDLRTGLLQAGWSVSPATLQKSRSKHVALAAGGSLFVSSGLYAAAGTGSSENSYAGINSDGSLQSFGGATGSNTLQAVGGVNLFNTRGIAYVDGSGVAHVMVLGGDDVENPGQKSAKVIFY